MRNATRARRRRLAASCAALALAAGCACASAAEQHHHHADSDFLVFLSAEGVHRTSAESAGLEQDDVLATADLLLTHRFGRVRVLAETVVGSEDVEVERLQLGWDVGENSYAWFGRLHQPSSAWNTEHHHGQYLQTAITRPAIEFWEDEGGLIPQHLLGVSIETRRPLGERAGLLAEGAFGRGPILRPDELEPWHVLDSNSGGHQPSWAARLAWLPDFADSNAVGILLGHHELRVAPEAAPTLYGARHIDLNVAGAYLDWRSDTTRAIGAVYYLGLDYEADGRLASEHFAAGYLQVEHEIAARVTAFGRHENSVNAGESRYAARENVDFALRRNALGLRWDFAHRHALTLEAARTTNARDSYGSVQLQWSGVLP